MSNNIRDDMAEAAGMLADVFDFIADSWFQIAKELPNDGGFVEAIGVLNAADELARAMRHRSVDYRTNYGRWSS